MSNQLFKNTAFLYALTFSNYFIGLLLFPYISRVLSVEGFGLVGFSMAYVLIFQVIVEFGFVISATALISKHRSDSEKVSEIISSTMYAKLMLAIVSILIFALSALLVPMVRDNLPIVTLFLVSSLLSASLPDFFFRGIEKMKIITVRTVIIRLLSLLLVFLFVRDESQILFIPIAFIISNAIALVVAVYTITRGGIKLKRVQARYAVQSIKESSMFFMSRLAVSVNQSAGAFLVGLKFSPTSVEAGVFAGATRISTAADMMLTPVADSLYPHMVNKNDYELFRRVVVFGGLVWFMGCLIVFVFANEICKVILGSEYAAAGDLLRILVFGNFMTFFSNMFGYSALVPIGKANHANLAIVISAMTSIIAYGVLLLNDLISLVSVCVVIASTNFVVFLYRIYIFWKNRHLIGHSRNED